MTFLSESRTFIVKAVVTALEVFLSVIIAGNILLDWDVAVLELALVSALGAVLSIAYNKSVELRKRFG